MPQYGCLKKGSLQHLDNLIKLFQKSNISFKDLDDDDDDYSSGKLKITDVDVKLSVDDNDEIKVKEVIIIQLIIQK